MTSSQRITAWLFRNHRWFGIAPCLFVMAWGLSGVMHPIMSRLSPVQAVMQVPQAAVQMHSALAAAEVLARATIEQVSALRVVSFNDQSYYQVTASALTPVQAGVHAENALSNAVRRYFNVNTGDELVNGDVLYAQFLALHFTGERAASIASTTLVTQFNDDYLDVNRLLPVYRVDFARDDGLRIYVETNPGRAAALVNNTKASLGSIFNFMHTWVFMKDASLLRKSCMTLLLVATFMSAVSGIWVYGFMFKRKTLSAAHGSLRRWHRTTAIIISLSTVFFTMSGVWHLWGAEQRRTPTIHVAAVASQAIVLPDAIRHGNWSALSLVQFDSGLYYEALSFTGAPVMAGGGEHDHHDHPASNSKPNSASTPLYVDANTGETSPELAKDYAMWLAGQYSQLANASVVNTELVTRFGGEYGFINKRLPVWQVQYEGGRTYYVETSSGALASVVNNSDRAEGYSFAFLHKYHWLDFAGKNARDIVSALFAFGNVLVAAMGLWLFARRYVARANSQI